MPDAASVVKAPVLVVVAPIGVLLIEPNEIPTPAIVPPVNAMFEALIWLAPKFVVPLIVFVPVALPIVLRAAVPAPNEFVKLAPVPIVEAPLDASVVNDPVLPDIGEFVIPPAVRFPVTDADASVASPLDESVVNAPVFAVVAPIGVLLIEHVEIATPPIVPPVNAIAEPVTEFAPWATVPPKFVVPFSVVVPPAAPIVFVGVVPVPKVFVKLAPVPIVEAPLDVSVVNAPVLPLIGLFVIPPAVRFPVTDADASVASPLVVSVVNDPAPVPPVMSVR